VLSAVWPHPHGSDRPALRAELAADSFRTPLDIVLTAAGPHPHGSDRPALRAELAADSFRTPLDIIVLSAVEAGLAS
jgi:hypothetical protein